MDCFGALKSKRLHPTLVPARDVLLILLIIQVYPIGIPVVFFVLLFRKRRLINPPQGVHPDIVSLSGGNINDDNDEENNPDPRLLDRRIAQTSFLWQAGVHSLFTTSRKRVSAHFCSFSSLLIPIVYLMYW